jgi:outer membrane protein assembly factor BamD
MGVARLASRGLALAAAVVGLSVALGGCSRVGSSMPGSFPSWMGGSAREVPVENQSPQQIYLSGEALLSDGQPREAGQVFSEVERLYPYSEWAKRAMLMSAFAYHEGGLYAESRAAAERYLEFFPADVDAPYAQFLIALSYYDQIVDIGRDQTDAFEALQEMRDIIERYPDSEYAKSAQLKFELALDHLAEKLQVRTRTEAVAKFLRR